MIKNVNQSMVNRSIARGGNCKCVNGGSNSSGVNGGKITLEFTVYTGTVAETSGEGESAITKEVMYMTNEDFLKLRESIYNLYQTKNRLTDYNIQTMIDQTMYSYENTIFQLITSNREGEEENIRIYLHFLIQGGEDIASFQDSYIYGKLFDDMDTEANFVIAGESLTFIDGNDPVLEGATKQPVSLTIYYRER